MTTVPNRGDWKWLEGTYWYCAAGCTPAIRSRREGSFEWVLDQTVWYVAGYADGYFWGTASVLLTPVGQEPDASDKTDMTFYASVTPSGQVQVTFLTPASATVGTGRIVTTPEGVPAFEMQMASGPGTPLVVHWAYMLQVEPSDPAWNDLPGAGVSVETMLGGITSPQPRRETTPSR